MADAPRRFPDLRPTDERTALVERLDSCREAVRQLVASVDETDAGRRLLPGTDMTIAGIVRHLAWVEDLWVQARFAGQTMPAPWTGTETPDSSMRHGDGETLAIVAEHYDSACARSRHTIAAIDDLGHRAAVASFGNGPVNLRWLLTHLIDETSRHLGHLDLLIDATRTDHTNSAAALIAERCIVAVHAHPDDESTKAAATISLHAARGVRCVLVSCTDGSAGRTEERSPDALATHRAGELDRATAILGYRTVHRLGHRDSGMRGDEPHSFATVDPTTIAAQLVEILEREQPDAVITYDPAYAAGHPDHLHAYRATVAAFARYTSTATVPAALYGTRTHPPAKLRAMHERLTATGRPSPYGQAVRDPSADPQVRTERVDVAEHLHIAERALHQHTSQVDDDDAWFFAVPAAELRDVYPYDDLTLLATTDLRPPPADRGRPSTSDRAIERIQAARQRAATRGVAYSCDDGVGRVLAALAAAVPDDGRIVELGTGTGVGLAWLVAGTADRDHINIVSVDTDAGLLDETAAADWPTNVRFLHGDGAQRIRDLAPVHLLFADAAGGKLHGLDHSIDALAPGGVLLVDDMYTQLHATDGLADAIHDVRRRLLDHPDLVAVEIDHGTGIIIATKAAR